MKKTTDSSGNKKQIRERLEFIAYMLYALERKGSWCGLLHIQKACYIAQEMFKIPLKYDFLPYKYGPYSFDLPDDISLALNRFILDTVRNPGYGPSYTIEDDIKKYVESNKYKYAGPVQFIAEWFHKRPARDLEKITSAHMVMHNIKLDASEEEQKQELREWKDKLSDQDIDDAFQEVTQKQEEAQKIPKKVQVTL